MSDSKPNDPPPSKTADASSNPAQPRKEGRRWSKFGFIAGVLIAIGLASFFGWIRPAAGIALDDPLDGEPARETWKSAVSPETGELLLLHRAIDLSLPGRFEVTARIAPGSGESGTGGIAFHGQPGGEVSFEGLSFFTATIQAGDPALVQFRRHEEGRVVRVVSEHPLPFSVAPGEFYRLSVRSPSTGAFQISVKPADPEGDEVRPFRMEISDTSLQNGSAGIYAAGEEVGFQGFEYRLGEHYGYWSLLPPLIAIVLAFWLREVIAALIIGILAGGLIAGQINIVQAYLLPSIGTRSYAVILLVYLWALGGLIGIWTRTAGATHFANWAAQRMVVGPRSAKFFTWIMGLIFHQGGTISTVLTGATVRSIGDRNKVSHEELSYVVDSTASPAAALIPFNIWPFYIAGTVAGSIPLFTSNLASESARQAEELAMAVNFFFSAIPFNFYAIIAVLMTLLFAWEKLPWVGGRMRAAMHRARSTGQLDRPGAIPMTSNELTKIQVPPDYRPGLVDFFGPIGTLLGVAVIPYVIMVPILGDRSFSMMVPEAFVLAVLAGFAIAMVKGMPLRTAMDGFISGCKGVTIGALILALAVTLKTVAESVGTAEFITGAFADVIPAAILPALFMLLCMVIAFSTGTSFGTYAIVFPIAMPLAWVVGGESVFFLTVCFASVVGGSLFGDQCSPISDTTILSSLGTGCDLMDHVLTQLPLALFAAIVSMALYTVMVLFVL